jgi:hypothetical protein
VVGVSDGFGAGESDGVGDSVGLGSGVAESVDASAGAGEVSGGDGLVVGMSDGWGGSRGSLVGTGGEEGGFALALPAVNALVGPARDDCTIRVPTVTTAASRASPTIEFLGVQAARTAPIRRWYAGVGIVAVSSSTARGSLAAPGVPTSTCPCPRR